MGYFNAKVGLGAVEHPNSNGKRLLELVRADDQNVGISCSVVMVGGLGEVV